MYLLNLLKPELELLLDWFLSSIKSKFHLGDHSILFPSEQFLLSKLNNSTELNKHLSSEEMNLILDCTEYTIQKKYGTAKYLFGFERTLYQKITNVLSDNSKR
jgi:hypothetical protein